MDNLIDGNLTPENRSIANNRNLNIKICLRCNAHNSIRAKKCRKCGYTRLRRKSTERRDGKVK